MHQVLAEASRSRVSGYLKLLLCLGGTAGCGGVEKASAPETARLEAHIEALASNNGLSVNGLSVNGLSVNGLSVNGLSVNGLLSLSFSNWFEADPATREMVMKYVVLCAVPSGEVRTYTNPLTGLQYSWPGQFGLAPTWSQGVPAPELEQQLVTACLAAHTNRFGINIPISMLGQGIPCTSAELATYSEDEACFFGNAFTQEGIFAANARFFLQPGESTSRACGLSSRWGSTDCAPIIHVGSCREFCTLDATRTYYTQCTYNGVSYRALSTRILPQDIYRCGDGVCQFTESCGTGSANSCASDCGSCE